MKIEFRSSGDAVCENCGATELLHTTARNDALEADLADFTAEVFARFEEHVLTLWEDEKRRILRASEDAKLRLLTEADQEYARLNHLIKLERVAVNRYWTERYDDLEHRVEELVKERAPKWRVIRRREQNHLEQRYLALAAGLRAKTTEV